MSTPSTILAVYSVVFYNRNCIGQNFAMNEEKVAVAKILRRLAILRIYIQLLAKAQITVLILYCLK